ncbi:TRAPP II complex [Neohortaea acidophila]|uniref:TRAPP II complex n=1 Tax=Neohortaea acidophila TaxID=245834 RepID=A0A6A6PFS4_9PEZI|nr:TRAPP II complex [Neohortaea acidophila]KAF2478812.1 TRAPP II complex [Neohortaea acidophila]
MAADRFSPLAPAHIRVLVLPIGQLPRSRFLAFVHRLQHEAAVVPLSALQDYVKDNELLLSPNAFPRGSLLFNYTTSLPGQQQLQLSPFELYREPLLVLGVKDGLFAGQDGAEEELRAVTGQLRERHPRVVHRQILVCHDGDNLPSTPHPDVIYIRNEDEQLGTSLQIAARDFSARFLVELSTYARALSASPGVQTPGQTARSLQRSSLQREHETPTPPINGASPPQIIEPSSPVKSVEDLRPKSPPLNSDIRATTSFEILGNGATATRPSLPESRPSYNKSSHSRQSSQDRASMQGFGSVASQEKLKSRGKARVGLVMASIQLLAGQWNEALHMFVEHTTRARALSDSLWHAKGLEGIVVCLLLHVWTGLDFTIPSICYAPEKSTSGHAQRPSVNLAADFRVSSDGQPSSSARLAATLPDLLRLILGMYSSGEGSLELPYVSVAEATIRFSKLLAILHNTGGVFAQETFSNSLLPSDSAPHSPRQPRTAKLAGDVFKSTLSDLLSNLHPQNEENLSVAEQAGLLSGISSVYAMVHMNRREAVAIKDMLAKLTGALTSARKRGAAEMGIHPAASLSVDAGAHSLFSGSEGSDGLEQMMSDFAAIYGVSMDSTRVSEPTVYDALYFGNEALKLDIMRALAAFCEAAPYPHAVLRVNASMLRVFGPNGAVDADPAGKPTILSKDEQARCITAITRTVGMSRSLGIKDLEADYWDDFLIRDVEFLPAAPDQGVVDLTKVKIGGAIAGSATNPLLYDPNASRPTTADKARTTQILVREEMSVCRITLQNPYDVSVDVESIELITDGVELQTTHARFTLSPMGIQRINLSVSPAHTGLCKITGCQVKIQACRKRAFSIISKPWKASAPALNKEFGALSVSKDRQKTSAAEPVEVLLHVIEPQPTIILDTSSIHDSRLMLLNGEVCEVHLTLRNTSDVPANIFKIVSSHDAVQLQEIAIEEDSSQTSESTETTLIPPGETVTFTFDATGVDNVSQVQLLFSYTSTTSTATTDPEPPTQYARLLTIPIHLTVNSALQVQRLDALPLDIAENGEYSFVLAFDVTNIWAKALFYSCFVADLKLKSAEPRRCHNHEGVLAPGQIQRVFMPVARSMFLTQEDLEPVSVRAALLKRLQVYWEVEGEERTGWVNLSNLTMGDEVRDVVIGAAISLSLELLPSTNEPADNNDDDAKSEATDATTSTITPTTSKARAKTGTFITLRAHLYNRAPRSTALIVHLIPHSLLSSDAQHMQRRIAVAGAQHRLVPPVAEGTEHHVDFDFCPLLSGVVELEVVVKGAVGRGKEAELGQLWTAHKKLRLRVV